MIQCSINRIHTHYKESQAKQQSFSERACLNRFFCSEIYSACIFGYKNITGVEGCHKGDCKCREGGDGHITALYTSGCIKKGDPL